MTEAQPPNSTATQPVSRPGPTTFIWWWRWFWRVTLVVSLFSLWYCYYVPSNSIAWANDFSAGQQQAVESDQPMILFFTGHWCVPCRIMKRDVWADQEVTAAVNGAFVPVMIDVDGPNATELFERYRVGPTPSTIITDSLGNVLQQQGGGMRKAEFLEMLGKVKSTVAQET